MRSAAWGLLLIGMVAVTSTARSTAADDFKLEEGFKLLFNGKNLDGWKAKKGGDVLDGKSEAYNGRFKVNDGVLVIDPKVKGDVIIETAKDLKGDVHVKFDFQSGAGCNNDLFLRGLKFDIKKGDVKNLKEGDWQEFEIIIKGNKAEFKCNGETQRSGMTKSDSGPLGLRAEFGAIQFRRIRAKDTP